MLKVLDEFTTIQGTGHLVGVRQRFVRLVGCSVTRCPIRDICDEPAALLKRNGTEADPARIVKDALREVGPGGWLHVTGGEPLDQVEGLTQLGVEAQRAGLRTHYQTSGALRADLPWDWITVSPKVAPDALALNFGQEMVLLDTGRSLDELRAYFDATRFWFYYLMPLHGADPAPTIERVHEANRAGMPWGFTDQMHKRWGVR